LIAGDYADAINSFYNVYTSYPSSSFAPKALYSCGWILENELVQLDSATTYYDSLIVHYPASEYVRVIAPKLTLYKQEKRRKELALQDSLYAFEDIISDSAGVDSLLYEAFTPTEDSVKVALGEEQQKVIEEKKTEEAIVPVTKEPVWNPRRRR
jgi:hypothetical protein